MSEVVTLTIERMAYGAEAIAHDADGRVVFVAGGAPGDTVEAELISESRKHAKARVTRVLEAESARIAPLCPHAGVCGGCPWAHLSREAQQEAKRANVVNSFVRVGGMERERAEAVVAPLSTPVDAWGYRNKVELGVTTDSRGHIRLGMHGVNGNVVAVKSCPLLDKRHAKAVKSVAGALGYLCGSHHIELERVGIRASRRTGELEVALWDKPGPFPRAQAAQVLSDALSPTSVVRVMTKGPKAARKIAGVECLSGRGSWTELVGNEHMRLSAPSFFQVSTKGAEELIRLVLEGLQPQSDEEAMDLYCGAGTFTLPLARSCGWVSAVESYGPAVRDLRRNLEKANLTNVDAVGGDAGRQFPDTDADIIVVDPPRAGLAEEVVMQLSEQPARALAYVSCDPATLARDVKRLEAAGTYRLEKATPVDLFPQTFHVECVCLMTRMR